MSVDIDISTTSNVPTPQEIEQYINRRVELLERGVVIDKFHIEGADPTKHYEWHKDDAVTYSRLQAQGFTIDDELAATSKFATKDGAGNPKIMDTRCYSIPRWKKLANDRAEAIRRENQEKPRAINKEFEMKLASDPEFVPLPQDQRKDSVVNLNGNQVLAAISQDNKK